MTTAYCIGLHEKSWRKIRIDVSFTKGTGQLYCRGPVGQDFHVTIRAALTALFTNLNEETFSTQDLYLHIDMADVPVVGGSYGLALCVAVFAAATQNEVPSHIVFTGCVGPAGEVIRVEKIKDKCKAARDLGFSTIMLPNTQLDMRSDIIDQIPVHSIYQAFSLLFKMDIPDAIQ